MGDKDRVQAKDQDQPRVVLKMNKVNRGGCPYTASFLCTAKVCTLAYLYIHILQQHIRTYVSIHIL